MISQIPEKILWELEFLIQQQIQILLQKEADLDDEQWVARTCLKKSKLRKKVMEYVDLAYLHHASYKSVMEKALEQWQLSDSYNLSYRLTYLLVHLKASELANEPEPQGNYVSPESQVFSYPWSVFEIAPESSPKVIKKRYHQLSMSFHPDKAPAGKEDIYLARMQEINSAYDEIKRILVELDS